MKNRSMKNQIYMREQIYREMLWSSQIMDFSYRQSKS